MAHGNALSRRFVVYRGETMTVPQAVALAGNGVSKNAAFHRLAMGWPVERAVEQATRPKYAMRKST